MGTANAQSQIPADAGPALIDDQKKASTALALVFAAGVVVGAAAAGSGSLEPAMGDESAGATGASVAELIEARAED